MQLYFPVPVRMLATPADCVSLADVSGWQGCEDFIKLQELSAELFFKTIPIVLIYLNFLLMRPWQKL